MDFGLARGNKGPVPGTPELAPETLGSLPAAEAVAAGRLEEEEEGEKRWGEGGGGPREGAGAG